MTKNSIKVYARLKPDQFQKINYQINQKRANREELILYPICTDNGRNINNQKFTFNKILNEFTTQDLVFQSVCEPVIESILNGYNGTVFTYGQTGSGKTHTMTGSPNAYKERGIIPRTIQHIFNRIKNSPTIMYTVYISYLEIYNECGFDLLDQKYNASKLEDLQRVVALEDSHGNMHLRNLTVWPVKGETDALQLLFLGDTNRTIAETPMNPYSSRSHCIFTLHIGCRKPNTNVMRRGKLHLVDLAGSERISKNQSFGSKNATEAKHINLSLYFLEQVIAALSESRRLHVPYRNSMLTAVLRDSLGGNCLTSMIATLSLSAGNYEETISTCKFAQRVATVNNEVAVNEEVDPEQEVIQLKEEIVNLKCQLKVFTDKDFSERLSEKEKNECNELVINYIRGPKTEFELEPDMRKIRHCFKIFKTFIRASNTTESRNRQQSASSETSHSHKSDDKTIETYKQLLQQRDREIEVLVNLLKKEKQKNSMGSPETSISENDVIDSAKSSLGDLNSPSSAAYKSFSSISITSEAQKEAFDVYAREINPQPEIEVLKKSLTIKMNEARALASKIETAKGTILSLRKDLNQNEFLKSNHKDEVTKKLKTQVDIVQENIQKLHALKKETDHIKHGLDNANVRLINRFKQWWESSSISPNRNHNKINSKKPRRSKNMNSSSQNLHNLEPESYISKEMRSTSLGTLSEESQRSNIELNLNLKEDVSEDSSWNFDQIDTKLALLEEQRLKNMKGTNHEKKKSKNVLETSDQVQEEKVNGKYSESEDEKGEAIRPSTLTTVKHSNKLINESIPAVCEQVNFVRTIPNPGTPMVKIATPRKEVSSQIKSASIGFSSHDNPIHNSRKTEHKPNTHTVPTNNSKKWEEFMKNVPLTGDPEIDAEITKFYRQKFEAN